MSDTADDSAATHDVRPGTARRLPTWGRIPLVPRRILLIAMLIAAWQAYISINNVDPLAVSSPVDVGTAFITGWADGTLLSSTVATMKVLVSAMVIGTLAAAILTTLAVWTKFGEDVLTIFTAMLNPLPSIAILPLAILWFGKRHAHRPLWATANDPRNADLQPDVGCTRDSHPEPFVSR